MGADKKRKRFGDRGALQVGDLRLLQDGSERGGTLVSNEAAAETVPSKGRDGDGERAGLSVGADRNSQWEQRRRTSARSGSCTLGDMQREP